MLNHSALSSSLWLFRLWCTRLSCPWNFLGKEYWSGLPFPTSGDLPDPRIKPSSLAPLAMASRFFTTVPPCKHTHKVQQLELWSLENNLFISFSITLYCIFFFFFWETDLVQQSALLNRNAIWNYATPLRVCLLLLIAVVLSSLRCFVLLRLHLFHQLPFVLTFSSVQFSSVAQ